MDNILKNLLQNLKESMTLITVGNKSIFRLPGGRFKKESEDMREYHKLPQEDYPLFIYASDGDYDYTIQIQRGPVNHEKFPESL